MNIQGLHELVALSREYGAGRDWVIGGGGNTSFKDDHFMWIKASGTTLGEITEEQFVKMDRARLDAIWQKQYPLDTEERERCALEDLMAARAPGENQKRPSVETLMHALFPHRFVFHTHPTLLNGLTCSRNAEEAARRLLGDRVLWIPTVNPGYILARTIFDLVQRWRAEHDGTYPLILIMQNHGLVVAGDSVQDIRERNREVMEAVKRSVTRTPEIDPVQTDSAHLEEIRDTVTRAVADYRAAHGDALNPPVTVTFTSPELMRRAETRQAFSCLEGALTPDHIVYSGHKPCYVPPAPGVALKAEILAEIVEYCRREQACPKVVVVGGAGAVAVGATEKKAELAKHLFLDALKVTRYAENFGGVQAMPDEQVAFIRGWEVEKFREAVSTGP